MPSVRPTDTMTGTTSTVASRRAAARRKQRSRGQVLVLFAGAMLVLTGVTALVIDVSWYWVNSLRIQRAADAASLAGAVQLPNNPDGVPGGAKDLARKEATKNGYTTGVNGVTVTPTVVTGNPRMLDVTIKAPIGTFFMRALGLNSIPAQRNARAEFTLPVPMGSPQNYYGVGVLNLPTTTLVGPTSTGFKDANDTETGSWVNGTQANSTINTGSNFWAMSNLVGGVTPQNVQQQWDEWGFLSNPNAIPNESQLTILGIELRSSAFLQGSGANTNGCVMRAELSSNGGGAWTTPKQTANGALPTTQPTAAVPPNVPNPYNVVLGGANDTWGRTWDRDSFDDGGSQNFRLRLTFVNPTSTCTNTWRLAVDTLELRVFYQYIDVGPPVPTDIYDPYGITVLPPQNFWGGMQSQGAPARQGDAYMTAYDPDGNDPRTSAPNAKYDPVKYYNYGIDMPSGGGEVWLFDPGFCDTAQSTVNGVNQGTGENWTTSGINGNGQQPVSAQYELFFDGNNTPYDITDDTLIKSSLNTFRRLTYFDPDLGGDGPGGAPSCAGVSWHNNWWKLTTAPMAAGRYRLHTSTRIFSAAGSIAGTLDGSDNQSGTTALNAFAIWTKSTSGTPHVYGLGAMESYFPLSADFNSRFYLAQIEEAHAGKWMDIDLWDPGDTGELPASLSILEPRSGSYAAASFFWNSSAGTTLPTNFTCGPTATRPNPQTSIQTSSGSGATYNGRWLRLCVHLRDDYSAPTPTGETEPGWWKIQYDMGGDSSDRPATDLTTWQVTIRGNPVHLVIP